MGPAGCLARYQGEDRSESPLYAPEDGKAEPFPGTQYPSVARCLVLVVRRCSGLGKIGGHTPVARAVEKVMLAISLEDGVVDAGLVD